MATSAPCSASASAILAPMPREPPVTKARIPLNSFIALLLPLSSSRSQLALDLFCVVNRSHVLEAPIEHLVNGVLHDLERRSRGLHADELFGRRARVDELRSDAVGIDDEVRQRPV